MAILKNLFSAIGLAVFLTASAQAGVIKPTEAAQHVGTRETVEGVVTQVSRSKGGTTFINFGGRFPNHVFYAVIFRDRAGAFPNVSNLQGRKVAIEGTIQMYKGKPQIILTSPGQIQLR